MYDIVIIGSGPAGLSSAIYAQRAGLKAVVVEKNYLGTGQIAERNADKILRPYPSDKVCD